MASEEPDNQAQAKTLHDGYDTSKGPEESEVSESESALLQQQFTAAEIENLEQRKTFADAACTDAEARLEIFLDEAARRKKEVMDKFEAETEALRKEFEAEAETQRKAFKEKVEKMKLIKPPKFEPRKVLSKLDRDLSKLDRDLDVSSIDSSSKKSVNFDKPAIIEKILTHIDQVKVENHEQGDQQYVNKPLSDDSRAAMRSTTFNPLVKEDAKKVMDKAGVNPNTFLWFWRITLLRI
jgi:hypothetical protein